MSKQASFKLAPPLKSLGRETSAYSDAQQPKKSALKKPGPAAPAFSSLVSRDFFNREGPKRKPMYFKQLGSGMVADQPSTGAAKPGWAKYVKRPSPIDGRIKKKEEPKIQKTIFTQHRYSQVSFDDVDNSSLERNSNDMPVNGMRSNDETSQQGSSNRIARRPRPIKRMNTVLMNSINEKLRQQSVINNEVETLLANADKDIELH